ncbi:MAG: NfeD family protein [Deltaproteobacteria bacterium]|nr:NfeD family protein [Deltaproteobacteria bacterium]
MPTLLRYLFFQIPGWVTAAVVAVGLLHWEIVPDWVALLGISVWVLKDLAFYPLLRSAYETHVKSGSEALVGKKGTAQSDITQEGYIRINGELWRAVTEPAGLVIAAGTEVEVVRAEGMKVVVQAASRQDSAL